LGELTEFSPDINTSQTENIAEGTSPFNTEIPGQMLLTPTTAVEVAA
jgi:hypothetical protein